MSSYAPVEAQDWGQIFRTESERALQADGSCEGTAPPFGYTGLMNSRVTANFTSGGWTGGCVEGLRDGHGRLQSQLVRQSVGAGIGGETSISRQTDQIVSEGTFVRGRRVGLWCQINRTSRHEMVSASSVPASPPHVDAVRRCHFESGQGDRNLFLGPGILAPDASGAWRHPVLLGVTPRNGPTYSDEAIRTASGHAVGNFSVIGSIGTIRLPAHVAELEDLVADGRVTVAPRYALVHHRSGDPSSTAPSPYAPELTGQRVALVLTTSALTNLERWRAERQALIAATARDARRMEGRPAFIEGTDPDNLVRTWTSNLTLEGAQVRMADDLTPLADGSADYVMVVDWAYRSRTPRDARGLRALNICPGGPALASCAGRAMVESEVHAYLIAPDLDVAWTISMVGVSFESVWMSSERDMDKLLRSLSNAFVHLSLPKF